MFLATHPRPTTEELGISDLKSGTYYGLWGTVSTPASLPLPAPPLMPVPQAAARAAPPALKSGALQLLTAYGFVMGGAIDWLGVRTSLLLCFVLNISSRYVMAATASPTVFLAALLGPNTMAGALGVPVMTIGVKQVLQAPRIESCCWPL